jgi:hypothetical protein
VGTVLVTLLVVGSYYFVRRRSAPGSPATPAIRQ